MEGVAERRWTDAPAARLGAFGVIVLAAFGGGAAIGAAFGPDASEPGPNSTEHPTSTTVDAPHTHADEVRGAHDG